MQKSISLKMFAGLAAIAMFFGLAINAYAYDDLEIKIDIQAGSTKVMVEYNEGNNEVEKEYEYQTTNIDEVYVLLADELGLTKSKVKESVDEINKVDNDSDKDYSDKDKGHGNDADKCDKDNLGNGGSCINKDKDKTVKETKEKEYTKDKNEDKWKDYGKSTDKAVLQTQIQELLQLLIKLLQQQMMLSNN